jgi:hypothetical protein
MGRARLLAIVLAAGIVSASCDSGQASTSPERTRAATPTPSATTVPAKVQRAIIHDYEVGWNAVFTSSDPPKPDDPRLAQHLSGEFLGQLTETLNNDAAAGTVRRGTQVFDPTVVSVSGASATVRDCYSNNWLIYAAAGNSLGVPEGMRLENPTGPRLRIVTLVQDAGVWKIDQVKPPVVQQRACGSIKDEQKVIDAWKREQRVLRSVYSAKRPNPRDPRLTEVFARQNNALAQVQDKIRTNAKSGRVVRGTSTDAIRAARVELRSYERGKTASIAVCFVDDGAVIDKASGAVLDPPSTTPSLWSFDFALEGNAWKVTSVAKGEPCVLG